MARVSLTVNGVHYTEEVEPRLLLVHLLRDRLGLTGTHVGCDTSNCGACTVHLDGEAVKSCTVLAVQADGAEVTTIEGMADGERPASAAGGVLERPRPAVRLLHAGHDHGRRRPARAQPDPTEEEVRKGLEGNLCRCTGYHNIVKAVLDAAEAEPSAGGAGMSTAEAGHPGRQRLRRPVAAPQGGPAPDHRPGHLRRRHQPRRPAVGGLGALARGAREDRLDRHVGGQGARRRRRRVHRRGPGHGVRPADGLGPAGRRGQDARPLGARQGRGQARRRPGRARHRRRPLLGGRRRRGRLRRLRAAAGGHRSRGGARGRLAARPRVSSARTRSHEWSLGRRRPRGGLRRGRRHRRAPRSSTTASRARRSSRAPCSPTTAPAS